MQRMMMFALFFSSDFGDVCPRLLQPCGLYPRVLPSPVGVHIADLLRCLQL